jgi:hypothetical protein
MFKLAPYHYARRKDSQWLYERTEFKLVVLSPGLEMCTHVRRPNQISEKEDLATYKRRSPIGTGIVVPVHGIPTS